MIAKIKYIPDAVTPHKRAIPGSNSDCAQ
jgi:hypothetical protein